MSLPNYGSLQLSLRAGLSQCPQRVLHNVSQDWVDWWSWCIALENFGSAACNGEGVIDYELHT